MKLTKAFKIFLSILISALIFYLVLRGLNFPRFFQSFKEIDPSFILPIILTILFSMYLNALRWMYILRGIKEVNIFLLFKATILGWFANILLPLNIGELFRVYFVGKKEKISVSSTFGSVAVEKAVDGLSFFALIGFVFMFLELPVTMQAIEEPLRKAVAMSSFLLFAFILMLIFFRGYALKVESFVNLLVKSLPEKYRERVLEIVALFAKGVTIGQSRGDLFSVAFISILMRIVLASITYLVALALGLKLNFMVFLCIEVFVGLIYSVATTLGVVGSFEIAVVLGLGFFGVEKEVALSVALIQDAVSFFIITIMGGFFLLKEGMQIRKIKGFKGN